MGPVKKVSETWRNIDSAIASGEERMNGALDSARDALKSQTTVNVALTIGIVVAIAIAAYALSRSSK